MLTVYGQIRVRRALGEARHARVSDKKQHPTTAIPDAWALVDSVQFHPITWWNILILSYGVKLKFIVFSYQAYKNSPHVCDSKLFCTHKQSSKLVSK